MITEDLVEYIKSQLNKNSSKDSIISNLLNAGWKLEDINEGFSNVESFKESSLSSSFDSIKTEQAESTDESPVVEDNTDFVFPKEEDDASITKGVDPYRELPDNFGQENISNSVETIKENPIVEPKIYTPKSIEPKIQEVESPKEETPLNTQIEPFMLEVEGKTSNFSPISVGSPATGQIPIDNSNSSISSSFDMNSFSSGDKYQIKNKIEETTEKIELTPSLNKNTITENPTPKFDIPQNQMMNRSMNTPMNMSDIVPKGAMISSYSQDILSANKEEEKSIVNKKGSIMKWVVIALIVIFLGGMIFAFIEGYVKIPWSNFSFSIVKKDPKAILLSNPSNLAKLNSYKIDTNISISSPSLSNITTGLASGEAVSSKDRDSIVINTKNKVKRVDGRKQYDNTITLKSSIFEKDINSNWRYDGSNVSVSIPDLSEVLGPDAPNPATVTFMPSQMPLVLEGISPIIKSVVENLDSYNIRAGEVPLYVQNEIVSIFSDFVKNLEFSEKGKEVIHGVDTYHYVMTVDRTATKKVLSSFVDLFATKLSVDSKKNLDEAIGSSNIESFDVWIGENDNNLYQIKINLTTPLSKVLGLNDSGIADNEVRLELMTTYYDLNIDNEISMPSNQMSIEKFTENARDNKIKNSLDSFSAKANVLRNVLGSFGTKSNSTGSCISPVAGSLFSPSGHKKSADTAISSISLAMNSILSATNNTGFCFSTSNAWAISVPLSSSKVEAPMFYCSDSSGNLGTISNPIKGTICK